MKLTLDLLEKNKISDDLLIKFNNTPDLNNIEISQDASIFVSDSFLYKLLYDLITNTGNIFKIKKLFLNLNNYWEYYEFENEKIKTYVNCNDITMEYNYFNTYTRVITKTNFDKKIDFFNNNKIIRTIYDNGKKYITKYKYDKNGNLIEIIDSNNNHTQYKYDSNNNLIKKIYSNGEWEIWEYDSNNNLIKYENSQNNNKYYKYDNNNNLIEFKTNDFYETKEFDNNGNLILNTIVYNNKKKVILKFEYNNNGDLIKHYNNDVIKEFREYDNKNRLIKIINNDGSISKYKYDKHNNVISIKIYRNSKLINSTIRKYNNENKLIYYKYYDGTIEIFDYNKEGNLIYFKKIIGNKYYEKKYNDNNELILINSNYNYTPFNLDNFETRYNC